MKYLLWLLVLVAVFFVLGARRARSRGSEADAPAPAAPPPPPRAMVSCAECGMHMPADEALPGKGGVFCCGGHRASFEARQGQP